MNDRVNAKAAVRAPAWWKLALEARAPFEFGAGIAALAPLLALGPRGDGHPVIVYPGFGATDRSTAPLRHVLGLLGYRAVGWGAGRNSGMKPAWLAEGAAQLRSLGREHGRKVSLIGQSLGGIYARELAKLAADEVRCVITLGTPFTGPPDATNASRLYEWVNGKQHRTGPLRESVRSAPPVPTTSIYSRTDGVVAWQCSIEEPGALAENIEIECSHVGMGVNPLVLHAIADRLAQPEGEWTPMRRDGLRRFAYPEPKQPGDFAAFAHATG